MQTLLVAGSCINSLTLNGNLYFLHGCSSPRSVRSLNLTTLEVSIIVENVDGMFGVAAYEDTVFWTGIARVYSTIIDGSVISELLHIPSYGGSSFRGITVVHPSFQVTNISCQSVTTTATVGFTSASPVVSQTHIAKPSPSLMVQEVAQSSISSVS